MRYIGIYWTLFTPMIKKSIASRFGKKLAKESVRNGKSEYRRLLSRADDLGPGNPMAMNAYFAYVFAAAWLGSDRKITGDDRCAGIEVPSHIFRNDGPEQKAEEISYYCFTRCPICEFCEREGIAELMPALCSTDEVMFRLQHGKLYREHTIARGEGVCDYWIVGDKVKDPR